MPDAKNITHTIVANLSELLRKGNAHASLDDALKGVSYDISGKKVAELPYSIWQLADHIRIAQWDILEFSRNATYISPEWPGGYWSPEISPESDSVWQKCIQQIKSDRESFIELLSNPKNDIYTPFEYGDGQSLLKEALVLADHNSYHTGEIIILRRMLNDWDK